jgi:hypothetical protein
MLRAAVVALVIAAPLASAYAERVAAKPVQGPMLDRDEVDLGSMAAPRPPPAPPPRRARVLQALAKQRARHLAALRAYRKRGVFAHDLDRAGEVYVWKDDEGHLDAIAAIMAADGKALAASVDAAAPQLVGVHLADVRYGDVYVWSLTSGFSPDELDRLQRPHTRPTVVVAGDDAWRTDEDARLATAYAAVESYLRAHGDDGLAAATDALMAEPELAWHLVDPKHHPATAPVRVRHPMPAPPRPEP